VACPVRYGRRYESWKPKPAEGRCATSGTATGQVLAGVSYYMLMICYPVTVGAVVSPLCPVRVTLLLLPDWLPAASCARTK